MFRVGMHCVGPVRSQNAVIARFSRSLNTLRQPTSHIKVNHATRMTKRSCVNYYPQNAPKNNRNIALGIAALGLGGVVLYGSSVYSTSNEVEKKADETPVLASETDDATNEQPVVEDTEEAPVAEEAEGHAEVKEAIKENEAAESSSSNVTEKSAAADSPEASAVTAEQPAEVDSGPQIPEHATYILIGAGTAAYSAQNAISKRDPKARILIIGEEDYVPYMRPPLSKELWSSEDPNVAETLRFVQWNGRERDLFYQEKDTYVTPKQLAAGKTGTAVLCGKRVSSVNPVARKVILDDGTEIGYDKCLIATGGSPKNLPIFEKSPQEIKDKVSLYRNVADFKHLDNVVRNSKSVTIVGGGFLGSELACALARRGRSSGLKVHQIFPEDGNMGRVFPKYLCEWTTKKVEEEGVHVVPNNTISKIELEDNKVSLSLQSGEKIISDHVVVAVGLDPRTDLADSAQLEVDDKQGGFRVNSELQARSNIWVAGDAACFYDIKLGRRRVEHHDHAVVSGRLAGENMTGAGKPYWHQSMFWSDLGPHIGYEAIGVIDSSLPTVGIWAKATKADSPKAVVEASDDNIRSTAQENATSETPVPVTKPSDETNNAAPEREEFGKGIVFYTRNDRVVGIIMWNTFQRMPIARKVLKEGKKYSPQELHELAKQFNILDQE